MKRLREWWATRRYGPLTRDVCETCHRPLRQKQRVEQMVGEPEFSSEFMGFSAVISTYCRKDAPA